MRTVSVGVVQASASSNRLSNRCTSQASSSIRSVYPPGRVTSSSGMLC
jgi:hypothetical protein